MFAQLVVQRLLRQLQCLRRLGHYTVVPPEGILDQLTLERIDLDRQTGGVASCAGLVHDGEIDNPFPDGSPAGNAFEEDNQLLGSRDLFRTTFALEREFGERAAMQIYWEHMSHGQILDSGRNQGLDYVGLRFSYRFDPDAAN